VVTSIVDNGRRKLIAGLPIVLLCAGCGPRQPVEPTRPVNVIIALADTLRADHMSCYGYRRPTTPEIDRFAEDAVLFERARSQSACTFPSVNSLLTSRYASVFHGQGGAEMGIPEQYPSLAELLSRSGYSTIAVSASPIVRATPSKHNPGGGFGRGFDIFDERPLWREAAYVNQLAMRYLDRTEEPFFLYLHYMDPHDPYRTPKDFDSRFAGPYEGHDFIAEGNPNPIADMVYDDGPTVAFDDRDIQHLLDLYDDEIAYFDREFGRLVAGLRQRGLLNRSILVLVSDHGEEFMEHGEHVKHCRVLYDTSTRVPLIVKIPRVEGGRRIASAVQNLDIVPTVLDYLGIAGPETSFSGASLRDLLDDGNEAPRVAFSDQGKWRSADDGRYKLLLDAKNVERQLFDLRADPLEQSDLYDPEHLASRELEPPLIRWLTLTEGGIGDAEALEAGRKTEERLRALGYLE